jgi:hypothetical protein
LDFSNKNKIILNEIKNAINLQNLMNGKYEKKFEEKSLKSKLKNKIKILFLNFY